MGNKSQSEIAAQAAIDPDAARILVVDDDSSIRARLSEGLEFDGYRVESVEDVGSARRRLMGSSFDLVLLDVNLPDSSGYDLLRELRAGGVSRLTGTSSEVPVLMVSGRAEEVDRVRAFEFGCDDYVMKPFSFAELRGRVAALLRRSRCDSSPDVVRVATLDIDRRARSVSVEGQPVRLTFKEFALLSVLASDPMRVFARAELLESIWGYSNAGSTRTLDAHACRLRAKLSTGRERYVINLWGVGYRLIALEPEEG